MKDYAFAEKILDQGIQYCEERDLDSWRLNMLSLKAFVNLETGRWDSAYRIAALLINNEDKPSAFKIRALIVIGTIKMRRGDDDALSPLLQAKTMAFETKELRRIIPSLIALLEYEWLTGRGIIAQENLDQITGMIAQSIDTAVKSEFAFWFWKARKQAVELKDPFEGYGFYTGKKLQRAIAFWEKSGNPYAQAIALFEGNETDKRLALGITQKLGATAINERLKSAMRTAGIKSIPRGIRKTTQSNPAFLTTREMDILQLLQQGLQNKEIAGRLFISAKTVGHHISSIFFKLDVNSRAKAVNEAVRQQILK
jgi:ATP/maltotriose-dependent transcriptional regulator MalT